MDSIIGALYDCFPHVNYRGTPEREKVTEEYLKLDEQVKETFGPEFADRLAELYGQLHDYQGEDRFTTGFRVGVRLMLEVFTLPTE